MAVLLVALFVSGCQTTRPTASTTAIPHPALSLSEFKAHVAERSGPVLDAREPHLFNLGHVPGALNLPAADFLNHYGKLKASLEPYKKKLVVVYCSDQWCGTGDEVQLKLVVLGYQHVGIFPGGWLDWQAAQLPGAKPPGR